jgi:hypothetical protein
MLFTRQTYRAVGNGTSLWCSHHSPAVRFVNKDGHSLRKLSHIENSSGVKNQVAASAEIPHDASQPMIDSFQVEKFRCFPRLELKDFGQFNIIVGDNASGKTALLEAIFFPGSGIQLPVIYRNMRGMVAPNFSPERELYKSLFNDLFYGFSEDPGIEIKITGSYDNLRKSKIFFSPAPPPKEGTSHDNKITDKLFTVHTTDADNAQSIERFNLHGNAEIAGSHKVANIAFITSSAVPNPVELAQRLSNLRKNNADGDFQKFIHKLFPEVSDLTPELTGGFGEVHCKAIGLSKRVPIALVSNGLNKVANVFALLASHTGGVVIIDEIENGIYHKKIPQLWESIIRLSGDNVQSFISTHSLECLRAISPFLSKNPEKFRLIRTETDEAGNHSVKVFKGENFSAALETGTEVR